MKSDFLLYGSYGFVGREIARRAVAAGLRPLLAGRSPEKISAQADELGLDYRVFALEDETSVLEAVGQVDLVLHCAGPFMFTFEPMIEACLQQKVHYLDITGEIPVLAALAARDQRAKERGVMVLPAVGFDVVPSDCLALHLKQRLPTATRLRLAFHSQGPAGIPPGTAKTLIEMLPYGIRIRLDGRIGLAPDFESRTIDLGDGPRQATRITWGDIFTAYYSTDIPTIENYIVLPRITAQLLGAIARVRALFKLAIVRHLASWLLPAGSTAQERAMTKAHVWGEVTDAAGRRAIARLHGPEGGVEWTSRAALAAVNKVLQGEIAPGFQTPAAVYGPDFALEIDGVRREDLPFSESHEHGDLRG